MKMDRLMRKRPLLSGFLPLVCLCVILVGCQPKVYLMPTPSVLATGEINPFALNPNLKEENRVPVFYATNRIPFTSGDDRQFTIFPDSTLHLGVAHLLIGAPDTAWERLLQLSTTSDDDKRPALHLEGLEVISTVPLGDTEVSQTQAARAFFDLVNVALAKSLNKDLMVYVHGANSSVYRASAQAAQFRHFTGRNTVVLAFLWPSAENLLAYGTDVRHAKKTVPAFARFIKLLAANTRAEKINILAYSAGSQIVSPGMAVVGQEAEDASSRQALRLGEVYFAAADVGIDTFIDNLQDYLGLPRAVTLTVNPNDSVLALAEGQNRVSRAGRPKAKDLSAEAREWAQMASTTGKFDIIGVDADSVSGLAAGSHDFWYAHPWISSDVLLQFSFHATPVTRGLVEHREADRVRYWSFPPDYPQRILGIIRDAAANADTAKTKQ